MRAAGPAASLTHAGAQQRGKVARPARPGAPAGGGARRRHLLRATGGCLGPPAGAEDRREQGQRGRAESVPQTTRTERCSVRSYVDRSGRRAKDSVRPGPGRTSQRASPHARHSSCTRQDMRRSRTLPTRASQRSAGQRTAHLRPCSSWPHTPPGHTRACRRTGQLRRRAPRRVCRRQPGLPGERLRGQLQQVQIGLAAVPAQALQLHGGLRARRRRRRRLEHQRLRQLPRAEHARRAALVGLHPRLRPPALQPLRAPPPAALCGQVAKAAGHGRLPLGAARSQAGSREGGAVSLGAAPRQPAGPGSARRARARPHSSPARARRSGGAAAPRSPRP